MMIFACSLVAFLLAGFGLGGGVLFIPFAMVLLDVSHIQARYLALIGYIPAALGVIFMSKNSINSAYKIIRYVPIAVVGTVIGTYVSSVVSVKLLRIAYGIFLILFGCNMVFSTFFEFKGRQKAKKL
jgi:uncharacterized membrane protein YfcA